MADEGKADDQLFQLLSSLLQQVLSFPFCLSRFVLLYIRSFLIFFYSVLYFSLPWHLISIFVNRFRLTSKMRYAIGFLWNLWSKCLDLWFFFISIFCEICDVKRCLNEFDNFCNLFVFFSLHSSLYCGSLKINLSLIEYIFRDEMGIFYFLADIDSFSIGKRNQNK